MNLRIEFVGIGVPDGIKCVKFPIFALGRELPDVETGSILTASAT